MEVLKNLSRFARRRLFERQRFKQALKSQQLQSQHPVTFNEKIRYKMARDASRLTTTFADKARVRGYVAKRLGAGVGLVNSLGVYRRASSIRWHDLPKEFVLKVTHASGGIIVVADVPGAKPLPRSATADKWGRYLVPPGSLDRRLATKLLNGWQRRPFGQDADGKIELAYRHAQRKILVEELVTAEVGGARSLPTQIMVHCVHGDPLEFMVVHRRNNFREEGQCRYLPNEWADGARRWGLSSDEAETVVDWARRLSSETDMVRVDLHLGENGLYFNELTNSPAAGHVPFTGHAVLTPEVLDREFGSKWMVPASYGRRWLWRGIW